jgi:hypothetical protein
LACSQDERPAFLGTVLVFHYINRIVNVFLGDAPLALPRGARRLRAVARRVAGATIGRHIMERDVLRFGDSSALFDDAPPPLHSAFVRVASEPAIGAAFARLDHEIELAGADALPLRVRALVAARVRAWDGAILDAPTRAGRDWVEDTAAAVDEGARSAVRLALLVAMASSLVDRRVVGAFQADHPGDERLVAAVAWASLVATRAISERLLG